MAIDVAWKKVFCLSGTSMASLSLAFDAALGWGVNASTNFGYTTPLKIWEGKKRCLLTHCLFSMCNPFLPNFLIFTVPSILFSHRCSVKLSQTHPRKSRTSLHQKPDPTHLKLLQLPLLLPVFWHFFTVFSVSVRTLPSCRIVVLLLYLPVFVCHLAHCVAAVGFLYVLLSFWGVRHNVQHVLLKRKPQRGPHMPENVAQQHNIFLPCGSLFLVCCNI